MPVFLVTALSSHLWLATTGLLFYRLRSQTEEEKEFTVPANTARSPTAPDVVLEASFHWRMRRRTYGKEKKRSSGHLIPVSGGKQLPAMFTKPESRWKLRMIHKQVLKYYPVRLTRRCWSFHYNRAWIWFKTQNVLCLRKLLPCAPPTRQGRNMQVGSIRYTIQFFHSFCDVIRN